MRKLVVLIHAAILLGLALPATGLGADGESSSLRLDAPDDGGAAAASGGGGGTIVRTIVGLLVVIAVIYGLTWVLRQVKASKEASASGAGLSSLATLPLAGDRALHLVRAGDAIVLVGAGPQGVTPVQTWTLAEAQALGLLDDDDETPAPGGSGPVVASPVAGLLERLRSFTVIR